MAVEAKRGCGYRKVNALYLCGSGITAKCDRLPFPIEYCPTCGSGIKFTQGFTWLDWEKYAGIHEDCKCPNPLLCFICVPSGHPQPYGLLWVGEAYYSPKHFIKEALEMGVSKRIPFIPKELKLGETVVLLAHKKAISGVIISDQPGESHLTEDKPGIFYAFTVTAIEMPIYESDLTEEKRKELNKRNITPVTIPDGDIDHSDKNVTTAYDPITRRFSKVILEE